LNIDIESAHVNDDGSVISLVFSKVRRVKNMNKKSKSVLIAKISTKIEDVEAERMF
jgi:hypothetical protein